MFCLPSLPITPFTYRKPQWLLVWPVDLITLFLDSDSSVAYLPVPQPLFVASPLTCIHPHIVHQLFFIKFSVQILSDFEKSPLRFFLLFSEPMHFAGHETFWNYQSKNYFCSFCIILCSFYTTQPRHPCIKCLLVPCVIAVLIHCCLFQRIDLNESLILSWNQEVSFSEVGQYKNIHKRKDRLPFFLF